MPAQFAILRTAKLKTVGNIAASLSHTYRARETPNADPTKLTSNRHSHGAPGEVLAELKARLPEKRRSDAVLALEFFVGASPEWFADKVRPEQDRYFADAVAWLKQRHGEANVVGWSIHRDETSPHLVAYVVPLDSRGKLNAKQWTGGAAALSLMQTEFAREVGERHGLDRGIEGSQARHQSIKRYYEQVARTPRHFEISPQEAEPKLLKKGIFSSTYEAPETVAKRLTQGVQAAYEPTVRKAHAVDSERRRAAEMSRTARKLEADNKKLREEMDVMRKVFAPMIELATLAKNEFVQLVQVAKARAESLRNQQRQEKKIERKANRAEERDGPDLSM